MTRPRIALFTPYLPAPGQSGGRIRIHRLALGLSRFADVELFAQASPAEAFSGRKADELAPYVAVHTAARLWPAWGTDAHPVRVLRACPERLRAAFEDAHERAPFDVAVAEHSHAARWAMGAGIPWVLDEHNVEARYVAARDGRAGAREARRLEAWQRAAWRAAHRVVCVTVADAAEVGEETLLPPVVVPNGVDCRSVRFVPPSRRAGSSILFVGLMDHPPNVRAAEWLVREVLPLVHRDVPDARVVLCGANPSRAVRALASPAVTVTGRVPSVAPHLAAARAYACPLREGAGSSLKVLEALASGVPLVATAVAVRGFPVEDGRHYRRAETAPHFAARLVEALRGAASDDDAAHGRALAERYDWDGLSRTYADVVAGVVTGRSRPAWNQPRVDSRPWGTSLTAR